MASEKVAACCKALIDKNLTIAFAESASAGKMSYEFAIVPDSGKILLGGVVSYNAKIKQDFLSVPAELIDNFTAESAEVTRAMAENFHKQIKSDVCVAITGLSAPGGSETAEKPVGTFFIHCIFPDKALPARFKFDGNPEEIISQAIDATAEFVHSGLN